MESVKPTTLGNKKAYSIVVATMKNMPGGLNEGDNKLFSLLITEGANALMCLFQPLNILQYVQEGDNIARCG